MNIITSKVEEKEREIETTDDKGNTKKEKVKRKILYILFSFSIFCNIIAIYRKYKLRLQSHTLTAVLKLKIPAKIFGSYTLPAAIAPPLLLYQKFSVNATIL